MNVVLASSEVVPFAATGGLGEVVGALPRFLAAEGVDCSVFMPLYACVKKAGVPIAGTDKKIRIEMSRNTVEARICRAKLPGSDVDVFLIDCPRYYDRPGLYGEYSDYADNCERFSFFSRAVLEALPVVGIKPDVVHVNDWHTALVPVYMKTMYTEAFAGVKSILTIHNAAYQGLFWHWDMPLTGLDWSLFNYHQLEYYGMLNFLKGGIVFADALTTVSPTYAQEILTVEFGCGLDEALAARKDDLCGILNGIDDEEWNPETDNLIPANYSVRDMTGRAQCRRFLQESLGLAPDDDAAIVAVIGRLVEPKGVGLVAQVLPEVLSEPVQFVLLGAGEPEYETAFLDAAESNPERVSVMLEYDDVLAHRITAGADILLIPSRFEPCGLNQMHAMRYGAVPIVRRTGGLADTVRDVSAPGGGSSGNGFVLEEYSSDALLDAVRRALGVFGDKGNWQKLQARGMNGDYSWRRGAREYKRLYTQLCRG